MGTDIGRCVSFSGSPELQLPTTVTIGRKEKRGPVVSEIFRLKARTCNDRVFLNHENVNRKFMSHLHVSRQATTPGGFQSSAVKGGHFKRIRMCELRLRPDVCGPRGPPRYQEDPSRCPFPSVAFKSRRLSDKELYRR